MLTMTARGGAASLEEMLGSSTCGGQRYVPLVFASRTVALKSGSGDRELLEQAAARPRGELWLCSMSTEYYPSLPRLARMTNLSVSNHRCFHPGPGGFLNLLFTLMHFYDDPNVMEWGNR